MALRGRAAPLDRARDVRKGHVGPEIHEGRRRPDAVEARGIEDLRFAGFIRGRFDQGPVA